jgi:hypothetical protein
MTALTCAVALTGCHLDDLLGGTGPDDSLPGERTAGSAARLVFTVQPSDAAAGQPWLPAVEVSALDRDGVPATGFTGTVVLTLTQNPTGASLVGVAARDAVGGVVTFPALAIDRAGRDFTLRAEGSGLATATSLPFDVGDTPDAGDPVALERVSGNGQSGTVGTALDEPYVVRVVDAGGKGVAGVTVEWTVTDGGGTMSPSASTTDADGRAASTRTLGTVAGTHTANAAVGDVAGSPVIFTATAAPGAPATLVFSVQPSSTGANRTIEPPVEVTLSDQFGNLATGFAGSVTISIVPATGTPGAQLSGTLTRGVTNGRATFGDLRIDLVGLGYRLRAAGAGRSTDSNAFDVAL